MRNVHQFQNVKNIAFPILCMFEKQCSTKAPTTTTTAHRNCRRRSVSRLRHRRKRRRAAAAGQFRVRAAFVFCSAKFCKHFCTPLSLEGRRRERDWRMRALLLSLNPFLYNGLSCLLLATAQAGLTNYTNIVYLNYI